jgi:hypothetical protein
MQKNLGFHFLPMTECQWQEYLHSPCSLAILEHHSFDTKAKTCSSSFKCNQTRYIVWATVSSITNNSIQNGDDWRPIKAKFLHVTLCSTSNTVRSEFLGILLKMPSLENAPSKGLHTNKRTRSFVTIRFGSFCSMSVDALLASWPKC